MIDLLIALQSFVLLWLVFQLNISKHQVRELRRKMALLDPTEE